MADELTLRIKTTVDTTGVRAGLDQAQREADANPLRVGTAGSFAGEGSVGRSPLAPGVTTISPGLAPLPRPSESIPIQTATGIESLVSPAAVSAFTARTSAVAAAQVGPVPPALSVPIQAASWLTSQYVAGFLPGPPAGQAAPPALSVPIQSAAGPGVVPGPGYFSPWTAAYTAAGVQQQSAPVAGPSGVAAWTTGTSPLQPPLPPPGVVTGNIFVPGRGIIPADGPSLADVEALAQGPPAPPPLPWQPGGTPLPPTLPATGGAGGTGINAIIGAGAAHPLYQAGHMAQAAITQIEATEEAYQVALVRTRGDPIALEEARLQRNRGFGTSLSSLGGPLSVVGTLIRPTSSDERALEERRIAREEAAAAATLANQGEGDQASIADLGEEAGAARLSGSARSRALIEHRFAAGLRGLGRRDDALARAIIIAPNDVARRNAQLAWEQFQQQRVGLTAGLMDVREADTLDVNREQAVQAFGLAGDIENAGLRGAGRSLEAEVSARRRRGLLEALRYRDDPGTANLVIGSANADIAALLAQSGRQTGLANQIAENQAAVAGLTGQTEHAAALLGLSGDVRAAGIAGIQGQRDVSLMSLQNARGEALRAITDPAIRAQVAPGINDRFAAQESLIRGQAADREAAFSVQFADRRAALFAGLRDQQDITGLLAGGLEKTARIRSIEDETARATLNLRGPDAAEERGLIQQIGVNRLQANLRDLRLQGLQGGGSALPAGSTVGGGFTEQRPEQENLEQAIKENTAALQRLTDLQKGLDSFDGGGSDF